MLQKHKHPQSRSQIMTRPLHRLAILTKKPAVYCLTLIMLFVQNGYHSAIQLARLHAASPSPGSSDGFVSHSDLDEITTLSAIVPSLIVHPERKLARFKARLRAGKNESAEEEEDESIDSDDGDEDDTQKSDMGTEDSDDDPPPLSGDVMIFPPSDTPPCFSQVIVRLNPPPSTVLERQRLGLAEEKCYGLLVRDDLILSSAYCASQVETVEVPQTFSGQKTAASRATYHVGPHAVGFVEVDTPKYHRNSGMPRKRLFLGSNPKKKPRLYCDNDRPVASALPIGNLNSTNPTWVPTVALRSHLRNVLWDTDLNSTAELTDGVIKWHIMKQSKAELFQAIEDWKEKWRGGPGSVDVSHPVVYGPLLEAEDPRGHRYHVCFNLWRSRWKNEDPFSGIPFFDWLDFGPAQSLSFPINPGEDHELYGVDLAEHLAETCMKKNFNQKKKVKYFTEDESKEYAVDLRPYNDGQNVRMTYVESGEPVINEENDLLWVWGLDRTLYAIEEGNQIGHSTLIASKPALSAGEAKTGLNGRLKAVRLTGTATLELVSL